MQKIDTVKLVIATGDVGTDTPVRMKFNGHEVALNVDRGSTAPGSEFEGHFDVHSVAHSVFLLGPESGTWEVTRLVVSFGGPEPTKNEYGPLTLAAGGQLDIWTKPVETFDV